MGMLPIAKFIYHERQDTKNLQLEPNIGVQATDSGRAPDARRYAKGTDRTKVRSSFTQLKTGRGEISFGERMGLNRF